MKRTEILQEIRRMRFEEAYGGYGVTHMEAMGSLGPVKIIFTIVKRKDVPRVLKIIRKHNPLAFFTIEDIRSVRKGVFPLLKTKDEKYGSSADK